jgi:hypothetical protein
LERISAKFDQARIATKRDKEEQDWHQQELWLHCHLNSDGFDVQLPSLIYDPTVAMDPKRTPATVSLSDLHGLQKKLPFQIMYFDHMDPQIKSCILGFRVHNHLNMT